MAALASLSALPLVENDLGRLLVESLLELVLQLIKLTKLTDHLVNIDNVPLHLLFEAFQILHNVDLVSVLIDHLLTTVLILLLAVPLKLDLGVLPLLHQVLQEVVAQVGDLVQLHVALYQLLLRIPREHLLFELVNDSFDVSDLRRDFISAIFGAV